MKSPELPKLRLLIVDDEINIRLMMSICLEAQGHQVLAVASIEQALNETARQAFDLIFLDVRLGLQNGLDFIPQLLRENPWTRIIVITAHPLADAATQAMDRGASDYLPKPFEAAQLLHVTRKVSEQRQLERKVQALQLADNDPEADFPSIDPTMTGALELARRVSQSQANLLISGEIGSGKGRLARAIHAWSQRANQPLVTITCRSGTSEADLFGKAEFCEGGTLVLEEIEHLPLPFQPRILRLLKDHEFERQDETTRRKINVRIIATTSLDLQQAANRGAFRADLLLALNVVEIEIPPLRNRPADIPLLARWYAAMFGKQYHRDITGFTPEAMYVLTQYRWPFNLREFRNLIERAVLLCPGGRIDIAHLPPNLLNPTSSVSIGDLMPLAVVEELHIRRVVDSAQSLRQAATILDIDAATVVRKMKRYGANDDQPAA